MLHLSAAGDKSRVHWIDRRARDRLIKVALGTFVSRSAKDARAASRPIVRRADFGDEIWLHFSNIYLDLRGQCTTNFDTNSNLSFEFGVPVLAVGNRRSQPAIMAGW
ncbi:hypothetical protein M3484_08355 [Pseudomonas sp. GX19020]|uniref:hypothetical protein n=1 Tax=Pseudomonas sp. GX19020 TaxID=2942277 RepID=UPI002018DAEF|nr:hypothetical protein [Pseudomonas sp. GX19020]MCL4066582.1 hypothetical protein [Pseudomonas sp. GX19020]